jgi:hypothetical protein
MGFAAAHADIAARQRSSNGRPAACASSAQRVRRERRASVSFSGVCDQSRRNFEPLAAELLGQQMLAARGGFPGDAARRVAGLVSTQTGEVIAIGKAAVGASGSAPVDAGSGSASGAGFG